MRYNLLLESQNSMQELQLQSQPGYSSWSYIISFTTKACSQGCYNKDMASSDNTEVNIKLYPNPTSNIINVDMRNLVSAPTMIIYNMSGQTIYTENKINAESNDFVKQIDMSAYPAGVYFVKLVNDEMTKTIKFIKQ